MSKKNATTWLLFLFFAIASNAAKIEVVKLTPAGVQYQVLQVVETKTQSLEGLLLWNSIPSNQNIEGWHWSEEPDFKEYLLQKGLAQLQDPDNAPPYLREAQEAAKKNGLGMWGTTTELTTTTESLTTSETEKPLEPTEDETTIPLPHFWKWLSILGKIILAIITFVGGGQLLYLIWAYFHRHKVDLILLGEPSTGKSWLLLRLIDPTCQESALRKIRKSDAIAKINKSKIPMGRFEIIPRYKDVPGSWAGEQLTELIDRKWFRYLQRMLIPQKRVWLILLAPAASLANGKLNREDSLLQLGALKMYVGVLASHKTPKPDFVAICIAKADLFMDKPPDDSSSKYARDELLKEFHQHITLLETTCRARRVKAETIVCSALRAWGTDRILKALETACYTGK